MNRFENQLDKLDPAFAAVVRNIPLGGPPPLEPEWLRCEMVERFQVILTAGILPGTRVLEVGSGPYAIATVPLAYRVGASGRVVSVDRGRRGHFDETISASGLREQVRPVMCDARRLPFAPDSFEVAACLHGIRSLGSDEALIEALREMLRAAPTIVVAESLPSARTDAQRAHLAMYDLREEIFRAAWGTPDDRRYLPLDRLERLVEQAGGSIIDSHSLEVDLRHALAYLPRDYIDRIPDAPVREGLLLRWQRAEELRKKFGIDHPPVGIVSAKRRVV